MAVNSIEASVLQEELRVLNEQFAETERQNLALRRQLHTARASEQRLREQVVRMRRSFSWRITFPVRALRRVLIRRKA